MALKSRLRRALGRPSSSPDSTRSTSTSSSSSNSAADLHHVENVLTSTPSNLPAIALTKTSSRLSKITSWRTKEKKEKWVEPKSKYPDVKNSKHQEMLMGYEMKFGRQGRPSMDGRWSVFSGVSPMASRNCSFDERRESGMGVEVKREQEERVERVEEE
jgi:hypothetical protein